MRRKDRECNDLEFYEDVFKRAETMFVAFNDGPYPYCIPVNFAKVDNSLYIHCATSGKKLDCIVGNPHIGFSLAIDVIIDVPHSTTYYKSIVGTGIAHILDDPKEKELALAAVAAHYGANCARTLTFMEAQRIGIIRIDIVSLNGKCNKRPG